MWLAILLTPAVLNPKLTRWSRKRRAISPLATDLSGHKSGGKGFEPGEMAPGAGFEPARPKTGHRLSRPAPYRARVTRL